MANSYNAQFRLKKISESMLDECPSIGERRKAALLKVAVRCSGSKLATLEQSPAFSGFSSKAAAELKKFLAAR